jgi:hypothetical protein
MYALVGIQYTQGFCIQPTEIDYDEVKRARLHLKKLEVHLIVDLMFNTQVLYG